MKQRRIGVAQFVRVEALDVWFVTGLHPRLVKRRGGESARSAAVQEEEPERGHTFEAQWLEMSLPPLSGRNMHGRDITFGPDVIASRGEVARWIVLG